jgi:hypothetical protein
MINGYFWGFLLLGLAARVVGGQVISATAGLAAGILVVEIVKFLSWRFG